MTNADYAKTSRGFEDAITSALANVEQCKKKDVGYLKIQTWKTPRQASKFRMGKGFIFNNK